MTKNPKMIVTCLKVYNSELNLGMETP